MGDRPLRGHPARVQASQSFLSAAFTPRQIARIEEGIRENARLVVQEAAPTGGGDFVAPIAKRLPLITISSMIGVPDADRVVEAADVLVTVSDPEVTGDLAPVEALGAALWTLTEFAKELAAHRERDPGDDLMTALVQAEVDGDRLTHDEILIVELDGLMPTAIEEFVRWATPVLTFRRTATRDTEIAWQAIAASEPVFRGITRVPLGGGPATLLRQSPAALPDRAGEGSHFDPCSSRSAFVSRP